VIFDSELHVGRRIKGFSPWFSLPEASRFFVPRDRTWDYRFH
jgi:hypothetical protein